MSAQRNARRRSIGRRAFLRGAAGAAIALPFLEAMDREDDARADTFPKRFLVFFTGLGHPKPFWVPGGTETDMQFGPILQPLEPYKSDLLVLEGIDMESAYHGPGDPHQQGIGHALTGTELQSGTLFQYMCGSGQTVGWGGGVSLDQYLAQQGGAQTKLPSLELGIQVQDADIGARLSYAGPGMPVPPQDDPGAVWDQVFADLGGDPVGLKKQNAKRHHVLDRTMEDYKRLAPLVSTADRMKIEQHLASISDIAKRLDAPGALGGACQKPDRPNGGDVYQNDAYPALSRMQIDLLVMAMACDLTRVGSLLYASVHNGKTFTWLGQSQSHHQLSHAGDSDMGAQQQLVQIGAWHAGELAYLIGKLKAIPEGSGTMLDNTVILWCTDIAQGNTHGRRDMPYVLAGSCQKQLKTGRHLKYQGAYHNDLLVTLANVMGQPITTFGNPAYCKGPLAGLTS